MALLWSRTCGRLTVTVLDTRTGDQFWLAAHAENALDVFYHPYTYRPSQRIAYTAEITATQPEVLAA